MSAKNLSLIRKRLLRWYDANKRDLPWRHTGDPYAIWLAETMLQQTQVKTALPYYDRFMTTFPSIEALAPAPLQRVLRLWSGLGYYRRAENIKKAAIQVVRDHGGKLPNDYHQLRKLPGIGDYTAGAVLSIAFQQPYPAIDGNVRRVFARLFTITDEKLLRAMASQLVSKTRPGDFNQALMELGATVCTPKNPRCAACPVSRECAARRRSPSEAAVSSRPRAKIHTITWPLAIVRQNGKILLRRRAAHGLLAGLWELPGLQLAGGEKLARVRHRLEKELPFTLTRGRRIGVARHTITSWRIHAPIYLFDCNSSVEFLSRRRWRWIVPSSVHKQASSSMTAKAVRILTDYEKSLR